MAKPRVLLIGGKPFNVPKEFGEHFDLIRHIEQDERHIAMLPKVDYIVVLTNWVNHSAIAACRRQLNAVPLVWVNKGWNAMEAEFLRRGIIKPEPVAVPAVQVTYSKETEGATETPTEIEIVPPTPPPEPPQEDKWLEHVRAWAGKWTVTLDRPAKEIIDCAVLEPKSADDFMSWLKITPEQARDIWIGYQKSRIQFCRRNGIGYEPTRRPPRASKAVPGMDDLSAVIDRVTKLNDERSKLGKERAALRERLVKLDDDFKKIDLEIEKLKPVLDAINQLQKAVKATKEKA